MDGPDPSVICVVIDGPVASVDAWCMAGPDPSVIRVVVDGPLASVDARCMAGPDPSVIRVVIDGPLASVTACCIVGPDPSVMCCVVVGPVRVSEWIRFFFGLDFANSSEFPPDLKTSKNSSLPAVFRCFAGAAFPFGSGLFSSIMQFTFL